MTGGGMQSSVIFSLFLPLVFCIIILGLGLSLRLADFARVLHRPKPVLAAIGCQTLLLPILCFLIVTVTALPAELALGMMMLAASPSGASAILYTHVARGDTALSITLLAVNAIVALLTLPVIVNLSMLYFYGSGVALPLQIGKVVQIVLAAVIPALIGIAIRWRKPELADRLERPISRAAVTFLAVIIFYAVITHVDLLLTWGPRIGLTALLFNLLSMSVGYLLSRGLRLDGRQRIAITLHAGIHNAALVMTMAMSEYMLDMPELAIPPAMYALCAYVSAGLFAAVMRSNSPTR